MQGWKRFQSSSANCPLPESCLYWPVLGKLYKGFSYRQFLPVAGFEFASFFFNSTVLKILTQLAFSGVFNCTLPSSLDVDTSVIIRWVKHGTWWPSVRCERNTWSLSDCPPTTARWPRPLQCSNGLDFGLVMTDSILFPEFIQSLQDPCYWLTLYSVPYKMSLPEKFPSLECNNKDPVALNPCDLKTLVSLTCLFSPRCFSIVSILVLLGWEWLLRILTIYPF